MRRKVYVEGPRPDIRVPFGEVELSDGNAPFRLYDTSGPYTDETAIIDIGKGLSPFRREWRPTLYFIC